MEVLKCPLCKNLPLNIRNLPCGHIFCIQCLCQHICKTTDSKNSKFFECPICKYMVRPVNSSHQVEQWAKDLPCKGIYQEAILLMIQLQKQLCDKYCDRCLESKDSFRENHAEGWCQTCKRFFCSACLRFHNYQFKTSHRLALFHNSDPLDVIQTYIKKVGKSIRLHRTSFLDYVISQKKKLEMNLAEKYVEVCNEIQCHFVQVTDALEKLKISVSDLQNGLISLPQNNDLSSLLDHVKHNWTEMNKTCELTDNNFFKLKENSNFETFFDQTISFPLANMTPLKRNQQSSIKRKVISEESVSPNKMPKVSTCENSTTSVNSSESCDLIVTSLPPNNTLEESDLNESFRKKLILGSLSEESYSNVKVTNIRTFSANLEDENISCSPSSLIILPGNPERLVIADSNNNCLKKFYLDGKFRYRLTFPRAPNDMALLSKTTFAVTVPDIKKISIVKSEHKHKIRETKTIATLRPYQNLASAFKGAILLCVFRSVSKKNEKKDAIKSGIDLLWVDDFTILKTFADPLNYPNPGNIALGVLGSIYVANLAERNSRVCKILMEHTNTWTGRTRCRLKHLSSLCTDRFGYVYAADMQANKVYRLTPELKFDGLLLSKNDGLQLPEVIQVHENLLIVAEIKGFIKIFEILWPPP